MARKGIKCEKHVINVTGGKHVNPADAIKAICLKMHEQQKGEKAYNTCHEKRYHTTTNK